MENNNYTPPKRSLTVEFYVGVFFIIGFACFAYLAISLANMEFSSDNYYNINASFGSISGLNEGAAVEVAGVPIGKVKKITLEDNEALVNMKILKSFQVRDEDQAVIRTKGIIGDRYVKIIPGSTSAEEIENGGSIFDTEPVIELEELIGKFIHSQ